MANYRRTQYIDQSLGNMRYTIDSIWYHLIESNKFHIKEINDLKKLLIKEKPISPKEENPFSPKEDKIKKKVNKFVNHIPKNYMKLSYEKINNILRKIFQNLESYEDIINLKNHQNVYDLLNNKKFNKLYNLIPSLEKLNDFIGIKKIKKKIFEVICYFIHGLNSNDELNHIIITGPPGVGKTTLSKIIGDIYLNLGFLNNNKFVLARRNDLIGKYLGHTSDKTQKMIDKAEGGILFIDEVYSLGNEDNKDSFAKECIDTINQNLTEKANKFLCIVAGYEDSIEKCFFSYNKGLKRRFSIKFNISNYSSNELFEILLKFVEKEDWSLEDLSFTKKLIKKNIKIFNNFAGDMQILFQKSKQYYSKRLMNNSIYIEECSKILNNSDINNSIQEILKLKNVKPKDILNLYV